MNNKDWRIDFSANNDTKPTGNQKQLEQFQKFLDSNNLFDTSIFINDDNERNYAKENSPAWLAFNYAIELQKTEITRLNAIIASQDETIKIMEDLINSEPRTFDKDILESLSDKSIKLAMRGK